MNSRQAQTLILKDGELAHVMVTARKELAKILIDKAQAFIVITVNGGETNMTSVYDHPMESDEAGKLVMAMTKAAKIIREQAQGGTNGI